MRLFALAALVAVAALGPRAAAAEFSDAKKIPAGGVTIEELRDWLQWRGYRATIEVGDNGTRYIDSSADGINFSVDMYDCAEVQKQQRCGSMQAYASFRAEPEFRSDMVARWHQTKRWTSAYITDRGSAMVQQDINLPKDSTYGALGENFDVWYKMLRIFQRFAYDPDSDGKG